MYKQPFESASGGVVIYVNDKLNHSRLEEFSVTENDFESLWIEVSNKKKEFVDVFTDTQTQILLNFQNI